MWYIFKRANNDHTQRSQELMMELTENVTGVYMRVPPGVYFTATGRGYSYDRLVKTEGMVFFEQPHDPQPFTISR